MISFTSYPKSLSVKKTSLNNLHYLMKLVPIFFIIIATSPSFVAFADTDDLPLLGSSASPAVEPLLKSTPSPLTGNIKVIDRQLLLNGKPFIMKAVCYSPVPQGGLKCDSLLNHPTQEDLAIIEKDFQMMHAAGVNTVRTYEPMLDRGILDLLIKYDLKTIVPVFNFFQTPLSEITTTVNTLKDHPSTLIWEVGNEWNYNYFYSKINNPTSFTDEEADGLGLDGSINCIKGAIAEIRSHDAVHPISTVIGEIPPEKAFWLKLPDQDIDLYGTNVYDGLGFENRFELWTTLSNKPLYIAECGSDAFNSIIKREDPEAQAIAIRSIVTEIQDNLSAKDPNNVLIGGAIFEWNDEWWKADAAHPNEHSHKGMAISNGNGIVGKPQGATVEWNDDLNNDVSDQFFDGIQNGPYIDGVFNEEWFGIVDINRNPRAAYYVLKELYTEKD